MNAPEHGVRAAPADLTTNFVSAPRIAGVDADAHDVAGFDGAEVQGIEGFVDDPGCAPGRTGRGSQHEEPSRRDHGDAE